MDLRLRPVRLDDEDAVQGAQAALAPDGFPFAFLEDDEPWAGFVARTHGYRLGVGLDGRLVPSDFLLAVVDGEVVGRTSIRHELNDFLLHEGGHIGYGVLPGWRRRGVATEILRQSLVVAHAVGVDAALLTCDDDNVGSAAVIERCGGELEDRRTNSKGILVRRYWIR